MTIFLEHSPRHGAENSNHDYACQALGHQCLVWQECDEGVKKSEQSTHCLCQTMPVQSKDSMLALSSESIHLFSSGRYIENTELYNCTTTSDLDSGVRHLLRNILHLQDTVHNERKHAISSQSSFTQSFTSYTQDSHHITTHKIITHKFTTDSTYDECGKPIHCRSPEAVPTSDD